MILGTRFLASGVAVLAMMVASNDVTASVVSDFDAHDSSQWYAADGWSNGNPFDVGWRDDHVTFSDGKLQLTLDDVPCSTGGDCSGEDYASGAYRTRTFHGYGRYEVRMKAASGDGVVSSFFTYTGPSNGHPHDEIDIEFLGKDTTRVQFNFFLNGMGGHEFYYDLGFDAADGFHDYAFEWRSDRIDWFVDGHLAHTYTGATPNTDGRIFMNLWAVDPAISAWAGEFNYSGPVTAQYDSMSFTPLDQLTAVPLPAGFWLLGSGLVVLGLRRRQR